MTFEQIKSKNSLNQLSVVGVKKHPLALSIKIDSAEKKTQTEVD